MLDRRPKELASARLLAGQKGLQARVDVTDKVDKRMLLMLCDNLPQVLERMPELRLEAAELERHQNPAFRGLKSLPVAF